MIRNLKRAETVEQFRKSLESIGEELAANGILLMGAFYTSCRVHHTVDREKKAEIPKLLVDTGSEYTWIPEKTLNQLGIQREKKDLNFVMANGTTITRSVGFAIIHVDDQFTIDEVVFAEEGDMLLLGARTLEGLNLTVDARLKKLVATGPLPAA